MRRESQDETQFTTKIDGFVSLGFRVSTPPSPFNANVLLLQVLI